MNKEEMKTYQRKYQRIYLKRLRKEDPVKYKARKLLYYSKVRSKEKKLDHNINLDWLMEKLSKGVCEMTNVPFDYTFKDRNAKYPSIDRIDNEKGYTKDNCRIVLWFYNQASATWGEEELKKFLRVFVKKYEEKFL